MRCTACVWVESATQYAEPVDRVGTARIWLGVRCSRPTRSAAPGRDDLFRALLGFRAEIFHYRRDFESAKAIDLRLKDHHERAGNVSSVAVSLHNLGRIAEEKGQLDEAGRWYQQSLAMEKSTDNEHGPAITVHQLGVIAQKRGLSAEAEGWYRQSLGIRDRIGDERGQATTLHQLGTIAQERHQFEEAERCYLQSLAIAERIGDEQNQAGPYTSSGD